MHTDKELQYPKVTFSRWTRWAERTSLNDISFPGVYVLAHFGSPPPGPANPQGKEILYIGEKSDNSLVGRWRQFNRSAFQGKRGHSGGMTYRQVFGGHGDNLYVAAFPVKELDEKIRPFCIRHIERKLILEFVQKSGAAPRCNRK